MFFKVVVQVVLLFGSETWVLTPAWDGPWEVSNTGSRGGSKGDIQGDGRGVDDNIHR